MNVLVVHFVKKFLKIERCRCPTLLALDQGGAQRLKLGLTIDARIYFRQQFRITRTNFVNELRTYGFRELHCRAEYGNNDVVRDWLVRLVEGHSSSSSGNCQPGSSAFYCAPWGRVPDRTLIIQNYQEYIAKPWYGNRAGIE